MAKKSSNAQSDEPSTADPDEEITRCICGNEEFVLTPRTRALNAAPGLYVQCERCNVWQHGFCMGFETEQDVPNDYYCEKCEPLFHRIGQRHGVTQSRYRPYALRSSSNNNENTNSKSETKAALKSGDGGANASATAVPKTEPESSSAGSTSTSASTSAGGSTSTTTATSSNSSTNTANTTSGANATNNAPSPEIKTEEEMFARNNRKRRSREEVILQRVLEQSAKEAREIESKRRQSLGLPPLEPETPSGNDSPKRRSKGEDSEVEPPTPKRQNARQSTRNSRASTRSTRGGAGSGAGAGSNSNTSGGSRRSGARNSSGSDTPSRRTPAGVRRCKPRVPSQRSTFNEMRRRVATMLDFASRTQAELEQEENVNINALRKSQGAQRFQQELRHLGTLCSQNMTGLEHFTQKLLQWEESYGIQSP